jgi:hypothetical protein
MQSGWNTDNDSVAQVLPKWMVCHPHVIQTGSVIADSIITVLLSTSILVGGIIGCLLDNLIPGMLLFSFSYLKKLPKHLTFIFYYHTEL